MLPASSERVATHTSKAVERRLQHEFEDRLAYFAGHPGEIESRLKELDREWDIERVLEANAATIAALGITTSALLRRRWVLALPLAVALFLLQHAIQGWCPPLAIFRRRRVRSRREIDLERYALKMLRGDFTDGKRPDDETISGVLNMAARR